MLCNGCPYAFGQNKGIIEVNLGADDKKFLSAPPSCGISIAGHSTQDCGEFIEHAVPNQVPMSVIDQFKVVNVCQDNGKGIAQPFNAGYFAGKNLIKLGSVVQSCQPIGNGYFFKIAVRLREIGVDSMQLVFPIFDNANEVP